MRLLPPLIAVLIVLGSVPVGAATALPGWLAGTWSREAGAAWADEIWTSARGGMMLGLGRTGFGPDVDGWETARIERKAGGELALVVQRKGEATVELPMVVAGPDSIEFASPVAGSSGGQRIRFWREGQLLMREVSRIDGSEAVRMNFRPVETAPFE